MARLLQGNVPYSDTQAGSLRSVAGFAGFGYIAMQLMHHLHLRPSHLSLSSACLLSALFVACTILCQLVLLTMALSVCLPVFYCILLLTMARLICSDSLFQRRSHTKTRVELLRLCWQLPTFAALHRHYVVIIPAQSDYGLISQP